MTSISKPESESAKRVKEAIARIINRFSKKCTKKQGVKVSIDVPIFIALIISLGCNLIAVIYIRDLLGRLNWITLNLSVLEELIKSYQKHLSDMYSLEQFYGDNEIKTLISHTADLVEVLEDYLEAGLDQEIIEEDESVLTTEDTQNDEKKKEE